MVNGGLLGSFLLTNSVARKVWRSCYRPNCQCAKWAGSPPYNVTPVHKKGFGRGGKIWRNSSLLPVGAFGHRSTAGQASSGTRRQEHENRMTRLSVKNKDSHPLLIAQNRMPIQFESVKSFWKSLSPRMRIC